MKKILVQINCKDELPEKTKDNTSDYVITDRGKYYYDHDWQQWGNKSGILMKPKINFWYKEIDQRTYEIERLEKYSIFLEKNGYMDIDWRTEEPFAIDEFLK